MKKAIIVGATSGIGNALAKILVENDYMVGITGRRKTILESLKESNPKNFSISAFDCTTENNSKKTGGIGGTTWWFGRIGFKRGYRRFK